MKFSVRISIAVAAHVGLLVSPVVAALEAENRLVVMTFNTWHDGTRVDDGFAKIAAAISASGADVVGLQESGPETAKRLSEKLGWHHAHSGSGSVQILSRHPLTESFSAERIGKDRFIGARIVVGESPRREIVVANLHLDYQFYGPYAAAESGADVESVLAENARSERMEQLLAVLDELKPHLMRADVVPVVLTGDFNAPSHLDWTEETAAARYGLPAIPWQESLALAQAGWIDSFRKCHPDPVATPGNTWSAIHKGTEPQDRIDFIYHFGRGLLPVESKVYLTEVQSTVGAWGEETGPVRGNTWPSDHAAVVTVYQLETRKQPAD